MEKERSWWHILGKAMVIGGTMTVPGASGGTMAMILGIYEELIETVGSLPRLLADRLFSHNHGAAGEKSHNPVTQNITGSQSISKSLGFLTLFCLGVLAGMALLARGVLTLLERYPVVVSYFFLGAVAGGIPLICRRANVKKITWRTLFWPLAGLLVVYGLAALPEGLFAAGLSGSVPSPGSSPSPGALPFPDGISTPDGIPFPGASGTTLSGAFPGSLSLPQILFQFLGGCILAVALILPGISVSQMLLMLGLYEPVMTAVSQLRLFSLIPLGLGAFLCTLLVTRLLGDAMERRPQPTYLLILGFVLGSLGELYPGLPRGWNLLFAPLAAAAGYQLLSRLSRRAG